MLPEEKTRPGSMARLGKTRPEPNSKGVEGYKLLIPNPSAIITCPLLSSYLVAVVAMADATMEGVHEGLCCFISAAIPATCGVAMLVPDNSAKFNPRSRQIQVKSCLLEIQAITPKEKEY